MEHVKSKYIRLQINIPNWLVTCALDPSPSILGHLTLSHPYLSYHRSLLRQEQAEGSPVPCHTQCNSMLFVFLWIHKEIGKGVYLEPKWSSGFGKVPLMLPVSQLHLISIPSLSGFQWSLLSLPAGAPNLQPTPRAKPQPSFLQHFCNIDKRPLSFVHVTSNTHGMHKELLSMSGSPWKMLRSLPRLLYELAWLFFRVWTVTSSVQGLQWCGQSPPSW